MIKKKYFLLLSTLLLTVFLGFFTSSYAFVPTENELKNFICNYALFYNEDFDINSLMSYLDQHSSDLQSWLTYLERYEGRYILSGANGRVFMWVYTGSESNLNTYGPYRNGVNVYVNTSYLTRFRWDFILNSNYEFTSWGSYDTTIANTSSQYFYYTDTNIYTNSTISNGSIWANSGSSNPNRNLFSGPYDDDYFTFLLNSNLNTITINGDSVPYIEHNTNQATTYVLGELGLAENFYNAELFTYRWQQGSWKLQNIRTLEYIGPTTSNLIEVTIRGDWINPNTLYSLQMNPDPDSEFAPYSQPFFVKNRYTSITNGALDLDNTFSGDYYNNYNNDTNTNDIINSITEGNPDSELAPIETMLSGDVEDVANNFGFWSAIGPNLFPSNIYNRIYDRMTMVTDVLYESGDVYFDFSMHGETPTRIHSSDIYLPNGALKTFISTFLIAGTCWLVWKQFYGYYELITTGNFILLFHDIDIDKTIFKM